MPYSRGERLLALTCYMKDRILLTASLKFFEPCTNFLPSAYKLYAPFATVNPTVLIIQYVATLPQFGRIKCVYCDTEDQDCLGFFWAEDSSSYRVDFCRKCKGYIKTVDERNVLEGKESSLFIEDMATAYLDILATEQGYK
ncbi:MAG: formate dehydrogenase accessory protein FdhE [bacterium]